MKSNIPPNDSIEVVRFPKDPQKPGSVPGFRIVTLHAFVCVDDDDTEGIVAHHGPMGWMPLVCADSARIESYRPMAHRIATASGKAIKLVRFSEREEIETINP